MAERANPDILGFGTHYVIRYWKGLIPYPVYKPYRREFLYRYRVANGMSKDKAVLDVPCGMGWGTSMLKLASSRCGVDISEEAIADAKRRYPNVADFRVARMDALPFADASFDLVCCLEGIEHVSEAVARAFLAEAKRVLRPQGELLVSSPYRPDGKHSGNPFHLKEYQPEELRALLLEHFRLLREWDRETEGMKVTFFHVQV